LMIDTISKPLMLIGMAGEFHICLIYGEHIDDPKPIILTVTPDYVAHKTSKPLPIRGSEFAECLDKNAEDLRKMALDCRDRGKTSAVLTGTPPKEAKRTPKLVIGDFQRSLKACAHFMRMLRGVQSA